jgi:hypothetical protein
MLQQQQLQQQQQQQEWMQQQLLLQQQQQQQQQPLITGFGQNNPFAPTQSPQPQPQPQLPVPSTQSPVMPQPQPSVSPTPAKKRDDGEHAHLANLLANRWVLIFKTLSRAMKLNLYRVLGPKMVLILSAISETCGMRLVNQMSSHRN